jgi:hypothetical protein
MSSTSPTEPPPKPSSRLRRLGVRALFVLACCITLIAAIYVEERIRGRAAWKAYETDAKQRGVKLEFADFIPPKIPDAENFASIPLFENVFRAEDTKPQQPYPYPLTLPVPPGGPSNGSDLAKLPPFSDPNTQKRIDFANWQKYFVEAKLLPAAGENAATDTLQALSSFSPLLAQLHEAGTRPHCRFPVHWERTYEAGLPHMVILQSASKFFALRMAAHLELGQSAAAYEDWHDGFRMLAVTAEEPTLINALVRISCFPLLVNGVWSGLAARQWAEPELRKIEVDLASLDWLKDYVFSMACERGALNSMADRMIDSSAELGKIMGLMRGMQDNVKMASFPPSAWRFYPAGWLYQGKVKTNYYFDETIARVDPERQRFFAERAVSSSPENVKGLFERIHYVLFAVGAPAFQGMEMRFVWPATVTAEARLACALERYRLSRGDFPNALAELAPEFLPVLPVEIVNGAPYIYRRTPEGGYVLYSVGPDLKDDGGLLDPKQKRLDKQLDWIWTIPGK